MKIFATTALLAGLFLESSAQFLSASFLQNAPESKISTTNAAAATADWPKINYFYSTEIDMEVFKLSENN